MARKTLSDLTPASQAKQLAKLSKRVRGPSDGSWAVVGVDTSMTSIAMVCSGWDDVIKRSTEVRYIDKRWTTEEDDYFQRLADSANSHKLIFEVIPMNVPIERIFIFAEEPFPMGMADSGKVKFKSAWIKQQCEVSGAVLGGLYKYGYTSMSQINNQKWKKTLRDEGVQIAKMPMGKWDIKRAMIERYGLPDLPDLVNSKTGGKVPRPESGFGARAKPVQPSDIYDAAACMHFGIHDLRELGILGDIQQRGSE